VRDTNEQIINHYGNGIAEIARLTGDQQAAVRTAVGFAVIEVEVLHRQTFARMHDEIAGLKEAVTQLRSCNAELATENTRFRERLEAKPAPLADMQHCRDEVARLNDYANGLKTTLIDQEVEIQRLHTQIALHTAPSSVPIPQPATISVNGTPHPLIAAAKSVADALAVQVAAAQPEAATPDPTSPAITAERTPSLLTWQILDDTSREIVRSLDEGRLLWRAVSADDKKVIVLAAVAELAAALPAGESLSIEQFQQQRPRWMPTFPPLSNALSMTWNMMLRAANVA
jgi:regulator of replication initiation timing